MRSLLGLGRAARRRSRPSARPAAGMGASASSRVSSPSSGPAPPAMAAGRRSTTLATNARAPVVSRRERTLSVNVPAGRRGWHAHPAQRRGRGGNARRARRRSLYFPVRQAASGVPARRRRPLLPRADLDGAGGAWRRIHGEDARTATESRVSIPEGAQSGRQLRLRGKGMPILRSRDCRRPLRAAQCRDAAEPDAPPAGTAGRVRCRNRRTRPIPKAPASSPR